MRDYKFRAWDGTEMHQDVVLVNGRAFKNEQHAGIPMQYTGLKDRNGKEVYAGDIIRVRRPGRDRQTHYGDNIPLGSYTEPLEPVIHEYETEVKFADGIFGCDVEDHQNMPLQWVIKDSNAEDEDHLKYMFSGGWGERIYKGWDDDKEYLFQEYSISSVDELIAYIGIEVIGNIHEHPHLLEQGGKE